MRQFSTGMLSGLNAVYRSHGGIYSIFYSGYFWTSFALALIVWQGAVEPKWSTFATQGMPALIGFSIAAFAIFFSVLDVDSRIALGKPEPRLNQRRPILIIFSSVVHSIIVQSFTLIFALIYEFKPFRVYVGGVDPIQWNLFWDFIGISFTFYSILLIVAAVVSIFRMMEIVTSVGKRV